MYLALIEAYKLGLEEVILDCDVNNLGSVKTLEALNGKLKKTAIDPYDGVLTSVYWFDVNETIRKYKDIFKDNISEKESIKK